MPSRAHRSVVAVALAAVSALPAEAGATKLAVIVRGAGAGSDKAASHVSHFAREYLTDDGRYEVVDTAAALGPDTVGAALAAAASLVDRAAAAWDTLDLDPACEHLEKAREIYEKNAAAVADVRPVADALVLLGAVHVLRGEEKQGLERFAQAVTIRPGVQLDPTRSNPSIRQVFQKASAQLERKPRGSISVSSTPGYAEIYVDGIFRGAAPVVVGQLTPGKHYLRLVRDGYQSHGSVVTVQPGREVAAGGVLRPVMPLEQYETAVAAALQELRDPAAGDDVRSDGFAALEKLLGVEHLFLVEARLDAERVEVVAGQYDLRARKRLKTAGDVFAYDARPEIYAREVSDLVRTQFGQTTLTRRAGVQGGGRLATASGAAVGPTGGGDALARGTCMGMPCARAKKLALYGGVGAGVVVGGAGGLMYLLAYRNHDRFQATAQTSPEAADLASAGRLESRLGDVLVPLGLAAAAAGLWTYFFYQPASASRPGADESAPAVSVAAVPVAGGAAVLAGVGF